MHVSASRLCLVLLELYLLALARRVLGGSVATSRKEAPFHEAQYAFSVDSSLASIARDSASVRSPEELPPVQPLVGTRLGSVVSPPSPSADKGEDLKGEKVEQVATSEAGPALEFTEAVQVKVDTLFGASHFPTVQHRCMSAIAFMGWLVF
eukprot:9473695-Pyramimonas_sp.AAC.1